MEKLDYCFTNDLWRLWENKSPIKIDAKGMPLELVGYSQGSQATNFNIKNASISLDAGISSPYDVNTVLLTHGHSDHSSGIYYYPLHHDKMVVKKETFLESQLHDGSKYCKKKPEFVRHIQDIFVPEQITHLVDMTIQTNFNMNKGYIQKRTDTNYRIIGVRPGDSIPTTFMGKSATYDVFRCFHGVCPCVGYGITVKTTKTKEKYKNLLPEEKKQLGKQKVIMSEIVDYPYFLYLGDTDKHVLDTDEENNEYMSSCEWKPPIENDDEERSFRVIKSTDIKGYTTHKRHISEYAFIMIECNFLYDEHYDEATKRNHMHYRDIKKFALENPKCTLILNHFSMRYKYNDIESFFNDPKNGKPDNVYYWNCANRNIL